MSFFELEIEKRGSLGMSLIKIKQSERYFFGLITVV